VLVRTLRWQLPVAALAGIGFYGTALVATLSVRVGPGTLQAASIEVTAEDLKMKGVKYTGVGKDGGRYDVKAKEAIVDVLQKGPMKLGSIDGDLTQTSGVITRLKATRGSVDNASGEIDLADGVEIDASNGLRARLKSAKVFNKQNRIVANEGVVADLPTGRIQAATMDFDTKTKSGMFAGDVAVRLTQDPAQPAATVGFARDARAPVDVRAARLDVDDTRKTAIFTGGTSARQGDATLQAATLRIRYEGETGAILPATSPSPATPATPAARGPAARPTLLEADGQVVIVSGTDQRITADSAVMDVAADTALFTGQSVEVQQGRNRLLGRRLAVDRKAGRSRLDSPGEGRSPPGRIQSTFVQDPKPATPAGTPPPRPATAPAADFGMVASSFKADPNAPTDVAADSLEVIDPIRQAVWRGKVRAQHGDVVIETGEMTATYLGETGLLAPPDNAPPPPRSGASPPPRQGVQLSKIEAKGGVVVTAKDGQRVTGQWATFDMQANTVLVGGGAQALPRASEPDRNAVAAEQIRMNLTTGMIDMLSPGSASGASAARVSAGAPATGAAKSATGPGGLPDIPAARGPLPAAPAGTVNCPPGRSCLQVFPDDRAKFETQAKPAAAAPKTPVARPAQRAPSDGWTPQSSPSPVYRPN
jgi:lipopolysaccharide export system protein LptA